MKLTLALTALTTLAFAASALAANLPATQATTNDSTQAIQDAQDSTNGSMTNADLTGNVSQDTSALHEGTTSGTTHGAIIDHTSKKKKKHTKKHKPATQESMDTTESGTTSSGSYGNENLNAPTTTQGATRNDEIGLGVNGKANVQQRSENGQSSTSGM